MFNSIAKALMIASRQDGRGPISYHDLNSEAYRHEERKKLELERQAALRRIHSLHI
ncbi:hypothetical protein [Neptunicoccus cionae]|uniref:Uncharacterized protein n=1 Tax=Neptunicoccus cionae TaxID=2035344 RepID=A0A916QXB7_9RHOB|nr:hypothetical protein [Amylibacter cionae]GGA18317.1 hypothetical protein GCM10011498_18730 [Amylibacter cionae]